MTRARALALLVVSALATGAFVQNPAFVARTRDRCFGAGGDARAVARIALPQASRGAPGPRERELVARLTERCTALGARRVVVAGVLAVRADADGVVRAVPAALAPPGGALYRSWPRVPVVPLVAALLDGGDAAVRAGVAGRIVVIELARPEERWPVVPAGPLVSAGELTAAWIELQERGETVRDAVPWPLTLALLWGLGLALGRTSRARGLVLAAALAVAARSASRLAWDAGYLLDGVGLAWALAGVWAASALRERPRQEQCREVGPRP